MFNFLKGRMIFGNSLGNVAAIISLVGTGVNIISAIAEAKKGA